MDPKKTAYDHAKEQDFGPLWQLKQNLKSKQILLREIVEKQEAAIRNIAGLELEVAQYEQAIAVLEAAQPEPDTQ